MHERKTVENFFAYLWIFFVLKMFELWVVHGVVSVNFLTREAMNDHLEAEGKGGLDECERKEIYTKQQHNIHFVSIIDQLIEWIPQHLLKWLPTPPD